MRVDDLFITEDISVLDAMRKLDETGLGLSLIHILDRAAERGPARGNPCYIIKGDRRFVKEGACRLRGACLLYTS